jgi:hypothetical protein
MSVLESKPVRHCIMAGVAALVVAALALAGNVAMSTARARDADARPAVTFRNHGDHCDLIPSSCSELLTVTSGYFPGDGPVTVARPVVLSAVDIPSPDALSATQVPVPKRPPRPA